VNMFLFPFSMIMGGEFTFMEYVVWNELPTALGNLVGGFCLVGLPLYMTHVRTKAKAKATLDTTTGETRTA